MTIDWTIEGKFVFTMYNYLEVILGEAPTDLDGEDVTPVISKLFQVNETCQKLDMVTVNLFHYIVTRFLYVAKGALSHIQDTSCSGVSM